MKYFLSILILCILFESCGMIDKVSEMKIFIENESSFNIDSLKILTDSFAILEVIEKPEINKTITKRGIYGNFKFWIKLSNNQKLISNNQIAFDDLNYYKLIVRNSSVEVKLSNYFKIINYIKTVIFILLLIFFLKTFISMLILKPDHKLIFCIKSIINNSIYIILIFLAIQLFKSTKYYVGYLIITYVGIAIFALISDMFFTNKKYQSIRKSKVIISSVILSNLLLFILGLIIFMFYMVLIY